MPSFASLLLSPCVFPLEDISGQDGTTMTRTLPGNILSFSCHLKRAYFFSGVIICLDNWNRLGDLGGHKWAAKTLHTSTTTKH